MFFWIAEFKECSVQRFGQNKKGSWGSTVLLCNTVVSGISYQAIMLNKHLLAI